MREALDEARAALATDDVPIGAVVVDPTGAVVGRGRNRREADADPTAHAEVVALRQAAAARRTWRLSGCTLVVTLEPCTMCAGATVLSRVDRLVFAAFDDKAGAVGSLWDVVRDRRLNHRPEVVSGVLAEASTALLHAFFAFFDRHFETTAAVVAIPVFAQRLFMDADGIHRMAPGAVTDRYLHDLVPPGSPGYDTARSGRSNGAPSGRVRGAAT